LSRLAESAMPYAQDFVGFGDPRSPWWFVWSGPSYPKAPPQFWRSGANRKRPDGLTDAKIDFGTTWTDNERSRLCHRLTWWASGDGQPIAPLDAFPDADGFAAYPYAMRLIDVARALETTQRDGAHADPFFAELFPLSRAAVLEFGSKTVLRDYRDSNNVFSVVRIWQRLRLMRELISRHAPRLVFMYGRSNAGRWDEAGSFGDSRGRQGRIDPLEWWRTDGTVCVVSPTPSRAAMSSRTITQLPALVLEAFESAWR
jgi:hypothetical protein